MFEGEQFGNRGVETKHFDDYDLVINHTQTEIGPDKLEDLVKVVSKLAEEKKISEVSFGDWPAVSWDGPGKHYVDDKESPKYFVKRKWIVPSLEAMTEEGVKTFAEIVRGKRTEKTSVEMTALQTTNSVLSEMRLAPKIKELLASDEVLEMFASLGIERVKNIDPLVAIIDRETKRKYVIYPHKVGTAIDSKIMDVDKQEDLVKEIKVSFEKNGVLIDDLEYANQIMVDMETKTVYFNDTEAWSRIPESRENDYDKLLYLDERETGRDFIDFYREVENWDEFESKLLDELIANPGWLLEKEPELAQTALNVLKTSKGSGEPIKDRLVGQVDERITAPLFLRAIEIFSEQKGYKYLWSSASYENVENKENFLVATFDISLDEARKHYYSGLTGNRKEPCLVRLSIESLVNKYRKSDRHEMELFFEHAPESFFDSVDLKSDLEGLDIVVYKGIEEN